MKERITWSDFEKIDIRVGTVVSVEIFKEARNPAFKMSIDFGSLGIKKSSAQLTKLYSLNEIIGTQVAAIVNFPPKQIATIMSECSVLGVIGEDESVTLLKPERNVQNGLSIG